MTPDIIAKYDSESESEALQTEFSVQAVTPYDTVKLHNLKELLNPAQDDEHGGLEGDGIFNVTAVSKGSGHG